MEEIPDRKEFEYMEKRHQVEKEKLMEQARVSALIEDILRNADDKEYKNLKYDNGKFKGKIAGHEILIYSPGPNINVTIDGATDEAQEVDDVRYSNINIPYGNSLIRELYKKIKKLNNDFKIFITSKVI